MPGRAFVRIFSAASVLYSTSFTSEDLPEPDTPVTQINSPSGKRTSIFLRLFSVAPRTVMAWPFPFRRVPGSGIRLRPLK